MGKGLSREQKAILKAIRSLGAQGEAATISRLCELSGMGYDAVGHRSRRRIYPVNKRFSMLRSLWRLEKRGLVRSLGRGPWNERIWAAPGWKGKT